MKAKRELAVECMLYMDMKDKEIEFVEGSNE